MPLEESERFLRQLLANLETASQVIKVSSEALNALQNSLTALTNSLSSLNNQVSENIIYSKKFQEIAKNLGTGVTKSTIDFENSIKKLEELAKQRDELLKRGHNLEAKIKDKELATRKEYLLKELEALRKTGAISFEEFIRLSVGIRTVGETAEKVKSKFQRFQEILSLLGISGGTLVTKITRLAGIFGQVSTKTILSATGLIVLVEALKQMWIFTGEAANNINTLSFAGGIMNDAINTSARFTSLLTSAFVDSTTSMKTMNAVLAEYGMMTTNMISTIDEGSGTVEYSSDIQNKMYNQLADVSTYLAKMGPMFGMEANQIGSTMGRIMSRFHIELDEVRPTFEVLARTAMGTGIHFDALTQMVIKAGDQLRWFRVPLDYTIYRFGILGIQMMALSRQAGTFWERLQPGEMMRALEGIISAWSRVAPEMYIALRPGAAPMEVPKLATAIREFYTKEPVEAMKDMADRLVGMMLQQGYDMQTAIMMVGQFEPFASLGRMAPAAIEALTSLTTTQLRTYGVTGDMNKFLKVVADMFPGQAEDLEKLRETQILLKDPLDTLVRVSIRILRILTELTATLTFKTAEEIAKSIRESERWAVDVIQPGTTRTTGSRMLRRP